MTLPHPSLGVGEAFALEFIITCALITIICGVWDPRNRNNADSGPLRKFGKVFSIYRSLSNVFPGVGFAIAAISIAGGPYTGASMNPVR